jgi:hypothetical protein
MKKNGYSTKKEFNKNFYDKKRKVFLRPSYYSDTSDFWELKKDEIERQKYFLVKEIVLRQKYGFLKKI